jgi:ABC-type amino acid transport substrate-binding protein
MKTVLRRTMIAGVLFVTAVACGTARMPASPQRPLLRVGVTSTSPPLVFRRLGKLAGLEVEMAQRLANALGRDLRFLELPWEEQSTALLDGRTDVVMSGMSVTRARSVRIAFGEPYLRSGLAILMRRSDTERYDSLEAVRLSTARVGVVEGTTGEIFARDELPDSQVALYPTVDAAADELLAGLVDVAIHDIPMVVWMVSKHEGELAILRKRLGEDQLAWAFRPNDTELRAAADRVLAGWQRDGSLEALIERWLPYWSQVQ